MHWGRSLEPRHEPQRGEARMKKCNVALDGHKEYTWAAGETSDRKIVAEGRIDHRRGAIRDYLRQNFATGSRVAVETTGCYYWIVDEIEEAGMVPLLVNARKAKAGLAEANHSDRLDVRGLLMLMATDRLPTVWIPPRDVRDLRELTRGRMVFRDSCTRFKNRIHGTLTKYGLILDAPDIFAPGVRDDLRELMDQLPECHRFTAMEQLDYVDHFDEVVDEFDIKIKRRFTPVPEVELIDSLPGVGLVLSVVIWLEVGSVDRFRNANALATYAGTTPRLNQSGKKKPHLCLGPVRRDVNQYLKWAYVEAGNAVCMNKARWPDRTAVRLYERVQKRRGHGKAIVAVARHLAESTWWILTKQEPYREHATVTGSGGNAKKVFVLQPHRADGD
jgi:transposase